MDDLLGLLFRLLLAVVFLVAAAAKLRDRRGTADALQSFGVPERMVPFGKYLLPAAEALAALLLLTMQGPVGGIWSFALLAIFTAAVGFNLARGKKSACRCFGEMSVSPIGPRTIVRNIALSVLALHVAYVAPSTPTDALDWSASLSPEIRNLWLAITALTIGLIVQAWVLMRQRSSYQGVRRRLDALEHRPVQLAVGTEAPRFELPTTDGTTTGLADLLAAKKPVMIAFTDPHCGPCQTLTPLLAMWQSSLRNVFTVGIVSRGDMTANELHAVERGLAHVMVQEGDEVAEAYGAGGTPSAVRIAPDGTIDSPMASGTEEIQELFESTISTHAQNLWQQATGEELPKAFVGLPLGAEPPSRTVPDLTGASHNLPELVQKPTMLVFWSPRCAFCHQMVDDMRRIEERVPPDRHMVYVTVGSLEENRHLGLSSLMLSDPDWQLGEAFKASGTPAAVLLEGGKISSPLQSGIEGVLDLAREFVGRGPQRVQAPTLRGTPS